MKYLTESQHVMTWDKLCLLKVLKIVYLQY